MIVCSCRVLTAEDVADAVAAVRSENSSEAVRPGRVCRRLGMSGCCGGCGQLVKDLLSHYQQEPVAEMA